MILTLHTVPERQRRSWSGTKCLGKRPSEAPSRRVRNDRVQLIREVFLVMDRFLNMRETVTADDSKQHILSRRENADRSLARSAWDSASPKHRPVGYGMIGRSS